MGNPEKTEGNNSAAAASASNTAHDHNMEERSGWQRSTYEFPAVDGTNNISSVVILEPDQKKLMDVFYDAFLAQSKTYVSRKALFTTLFGKKKYSAQEKNHLNQLLTHISHKLRKIGYALVFIVPEAEAPKNKKGEMKNILYYIDTAESADKTIENGGKLKKPNSEDRISKISDAEARQISEARFDLAKRVLSGYSASLIKPHRVEPPSKLKDSPRQESRHWNPNNPRFIVREIAASHSLKEEQLIRDENDPYRYSRVIIESAAAALIKFWNVENTAGPVKPVTDAIAWIKRRKQGALAENVSQEMQDSALITEVIKNLCELYGYPFERIDVAKLKPRNR